MRIEVGLRPGSSAVKCEWSGCERHSRCLVRLREVDGIRFLCLNHVLAAWRREHFASRRESARNWLITPEKLPNGDHSLPADAVNS